VNAPKMTAPGSKHSKSIATGSPSGRRAPPYFSLACGNLAEVIEYVRQRIVESPGGEFIILREDEVHSHGHYVKVDILVSEYANGLPWGPTQRAIAKDALLVAYTALQACFHDS
jgi:hypothetical protein